MSRSSAFFAAGGFSGWEELAADGLQRCFSCGETKRHECFYSSASRALHRHCKECLKEKREEKARAKKAAIGVSTRCCAYCGATLLDAHHSRRYCQPCSAKKQQQHQKAYYARTSSKRLVRTKTCEKCGVSKPFSAWSRTPGGTLNRYCLECSMGAKPATDEEVREKRRKYKELKRRSVGALTRYELSKKAAARRESERRAKEERAAARVGPPWPPRRSAAERERWRIRNDPCHLLNVRMRVQIRKALRGMKAGRKWEQLVGYTVHELHEHLRRQMPKGYTMADFVGGKLHIDHIIPKSMFDVTKPEELAACWALPNLRPLPAEKNIKKGARLESLL